MYTEAAQQLRRCAATSRSTGQRCRAYAIWNHPDQLCAVHAQRPRTQHGRRHYPPPPCTCPAHPFPHRPASGQCNWPNTEQTEPSEADADADVLARARRDLDDLEDDVVPVDVGAPAGPPRRLAFGSVDRGSW